MTGDSGNSGTPGQYPGPDPDDPFAKPIDETAPIQKTPDAPAAPAPAQSEEVGYWEKQAREQQAAQAQTQSLSGQPDYQQNPSTAQYPTSDPGSHPGPPSQAAPAGHNPWAGYGAAAPAGGVPPLQYGGGPGGVPGYGVPVVFQPSHPQATTALVLGLISVIGAFLFCGVTLFVAPFAWWIGGKALKEIRASGGQLGGEGNAKAGYIMGIIGTVLLALAIVALIVFVVLIVVGASSSSGFSSSTEF